jgi:hypothetical protein
MENDQWQSTLTQILGKWLMATDRLRTHLSNAPVDENLEITLIKRIGQAQTLPNVLLLLQLLQGMGLPSDLVTLKMVEPLLSALLVTANRKHISSDHQRILTFSSKTSLLSMESDDEVDGDFVSAVMWDLMETLDVT